MGFKIYNYRAFLSNINPLNSFRTFLIGIFLSLMSVLATPTIAFAADQSTPQISATDKLINVAADQLATLGDKIGQLANTYGADTWKLVEMSARIDAISYLIPYGMCILIGIVITFTIFKILIPETNARQRYTDSKIFLTIATLGASLLAIALFLIGLCNIVDPWAWAGIFESKLWIAHKILFK